MLAVGDVNSAPILIDETRSLSPPYNTALAFLRAGNGIVTY